MKKLSTSKLISILVVSILLLSGFSSFVFAAPHTLTASISATSGPVSVGDTITVTMAVTASDPSETYYAEDVYAYISNITRTGGAAVTLESGPTPTNQDIPHNATRTFTWTYTATAAGTVSFTGYARDYIGSDDVYSNYATSNTVTINPPTRPDAIDDSATALKNTCVTISVLDNDTDPNSDSLTITEVSIPPHGSATISGNKILYCPETNWCSNTDTDSFTYTISDGTETDTATVSVLVYCGCIPDSEDIDLSLTPSINCDQTYTLDLDTLTISSRTDWEKVSECKTGLCGNLTFDSSSQVYTYDPGSPSSCCCGTNTFYLRVSKIWDDTWYYRWVKVTVTVICASPNNPPVAVDDSNSTVDDTTCKEINVTRNDTDTDGDPLTVISVTTPTFGSASIINPTGGIIRFCPSGSCGTATFDYNISDENGGTDIGTVTFTVPCNNPPTAVDDTETINEDTCVNVTVLDDDTDPENDPLSLLSISVAPDHGTATISGGKIWYCPDKDWCGHDDFNYTISDGNGGTDEANVTITLICDGADPPAATDDSGTTNEDTCVDVNVTTNDSDPDGQPISLQSFTQGLYGTVTDQGSGVLRYCPDPNWCGTDNYNYTVTDGALTDTAKVTITVNCVNDPPVANDDYYSTDVNTELVIPALGVLANDTDPDGDPLEVYMHETDVTSPANGTLAINENGSFTYTPNDGFCGEDTFTYRAGDFDAVSERATVTIEVKCRKNNPLPESILYPGIDIERLNVPSTGINVISDGKVVSQLQIAPGTQSILVEVENRGFLTQTDVGVRFEGLPQGVTYSNSQLQKVKAHNIARYSITLTASPDVPEGTYQIRAVAYSRKGPRDRIDLTLSIE